MGELWWLDHLDVRGFEQIHLMDDVMGQVAVPEGDGVLRRLVPNYFDILVLLGEYPNYVVPEN
jgi:hypothetical protein